MSSTELIKASVYDQFVTQAELTPGIAAITAPGRSPLTYARLRSQLESVRESLNAFGLGRNDRVVIVLDNGPEMAVAFMAMAFNNFGRTAAGQIMEWVFYAQLVTLAVWLGIRRMGVR